MSAIEMISSKITDVRPSPLVWHWALLLMTVLTGCSNNEAIGRTAIKSIKNATYAYTGKDDLGRTLGLPGDEQIPTYDHSKAVGVFYFVWHGATSAEGPFDVSKIIANDPKAADSSDAWRLAGGGHVGQRHWWGTPLFGYFRAADQWVVEKDVQLLTDAGVDFIALDYSNTPSYPKELDVLLKCLDKYFKQGFNVPQVTFITKAFSAKKIMDLYKNAYLAKPEYEYLWYHLEGKPLIIGNPNAPELSQEFKDYFTIKYAQWPRESYNDNGFPWVDFKRPQRLFGRQEERTTIMSVSVAQHSGTRAFSCSAFYGDDTNKTRSYRKGANDTAEDAYLYGHNFAEQFEHAIETNPDIIFVTGWNEWIATRLRSWADMDGKDIEHPVILVDGADINNSRDIQPMEGGFGDNYYMQLVGYIRKFKGCKIVNRNLNTAAATSKTTIDIKKDFSQWNRVETFYLDYTGDITERNHPGFGELIYQDYTGRNDIHIMKVANDDKNLYFYAETVSAIIDFDKDNCMSLFLITGNNRDRWYGYDFVINRTAPSSRKMRVERHSSENEWVLHGKIDYKMKGNKIQFAIPLSMLGYADNTVSIEFKWADNYLEEDGVWSFYKRGDAAPYGRLNYLYKAASGF